MAHPYYGNRMRYRANPESDPFDEYGWYEGDVFADQTPDASAPGAGGEGEAGDGDEWWQDVVTGGVSIVDKIIGAATGQTDKPAPSGPTVDPFAGTSPKKKVPTWVWFVGAGAIGLFVMSRRR